MHIRTFSAKVKAFENVLKLYFETNYLSLNLFSALEFFVGDFFLKKFVL